MSKYVIEAKERAGDEEKYTVENGAVHRMWIDGIAILVFHILYDTVHVPVVYYNCKTHKFCDHRGK